MQRHRLIHGTDFVVAVRALGKDPQPKVDLGKGAKADNVVQGRYEGQRAWQAARCCFQVWLAPGPDERARVNQTRGGESITAAPAPPS